jgi:hypothetical protein
VDEGMQCITLFTAQLVPGVLQGFLQQLVAIVQAAAAVVGGHLHLQH